MVPMYAQRCVSDDWRGLRSCLICSYSLWAFDGCFGLHLACLCWLMYMNLPWTEHTGRSKKEAGTLRLERLLFVWGRFWLFWCLLILPWAPLPQPSALFSEPLSFSLCTHLLVFLKSRSCVGPSLLTSTPHFVLKPTLPELQQTLGPPCHLQLPTLQPVLTTSDQIFCPD